MKGKMSDKNEGKRKENLNNNGKIFTSTHRNAFRVTH